MPTFSATVLNPRDFSASGVFLHVTWFPVSVFNMRIRIQLFTLIRIRIQLFTYMRIRILLLKIQWYESATIGLQTLQGSILSLQASFVSVHCSIWAYKPPRWASTALFWASKGVRNLRYIRELKDKTIAIRKQSAWKLHCKTRRAYLLNLFSISGKEIFQSVPRSKQYLGPVLRISSRKYDPGCSSQIPLDFLPIPDPSVADPGCLSRILIFTHPGSRISDPDPKTATKERGEKKFYHFFL